jgi:hypothetical protein
MTSTISNPKRPREDDVLECFLYPRFCYSLNTDQITEDMLREEINKFKQDVEPYVKDYLWHRDALTFNIRTKQALQFDIIIEDSLKTMGNLMRSLIELKPIFCSFFKN